MNSIGCGACVDINTKGSARLVSKPNLFSSCLWTDATIIIGTVYKSLIYYSLTTASTHLSKNFIFTMGVFSSRRPPPETIPGDRIIPLSFWDDQDYARGMSLDITLTFNDVLDPEKLRGALNTLLQKKGWEKFGARLRKNVRLAQTSRKLQYP